MPEIQAMIEEDLSQSTQKKTSLAPAARFIGYFSRKGAKNAKLAKGRGENKKALAPPLSKILTYSQ